MEDLILYDIDPDYTTKDEFEILYYEGLFLEEGSEN